MLMTKWKFVVAIGFGRVVERSLLKMRWLDIFVVMEQLLGTVILREISTMSNGSHLPNLVYNNMDGVMFLVKSSSLHPRHFPSVHY